MRRCEDRLAEALKAREPVTYDGTLNYDGPVQRASSVTMSATTAKGPLFKGVKIENTWHEQKSC
jgi:hypothetical protein